MWLLRLYAMLFLFFTRSFCYNVQFITHLGDVLEEPAFKKGTALLIKNEAVTIDSATEVCVFSPFSRMPKFNLTYALKILKSKGHSNTMPSIDSVTLCKTAQTKQIMPYHIKTSKKATTFGKKLLAIKRSRRLWDKQRSLSYRQRWTHMTILMNAIAELSVWLVPWNPVQRQACSVFSNVSLWNENSALEADVSKFVRELKSFHQMLARVQIKKSTLWQTNPKPYKKVC